MKEKLLHVTEAKRQLGTKIPWIADSLKADLERGFGGSPNAEFVIDPKGKVIHKRFWSNPTLLRKELQKLVGKVAKPTTLADLNMPAPAKAKRAPRGVVPRLKVPQRLRALKVVPQIEKGQKPLYVKLRAEADRKLLDEGKGKLYIGLFLDPLYKVHWNNETPPVQVRLQGSELTKITPDKLTGPKVKQKADSDPREFLLEVDTVDLDSPLVVTVNYVACDDAQTFCLPLTQKFHIQLIENRLGGWRLTGGGSPFGNSFGKFVDKMKAQALANGGLLKRKDVPPRLVIFYELLDANQDGRVEAAEIDLMRERFR